MSGYAVALALAVVVLLTIVQLLRTRRVREKYATAWLAVAFVVVVLSVFPGLLARVARLVGVATPVNLLFALALAVLLIVCIQYSVEISSLEAETRTLAETLALLDFQVRQLSHPPIDPDGHAALPVTAGESSGAQGRRADPGDEAAGERSIDSAGGGDGMNGEGL